MRRSPLPAIVLAPGLALALAWTLVACSSQASRPATPSPSGAPSSPAAAASQPIAEPATPPTTAAPTAGPTTAGPTAAPSPTARSVEYPPIAAPYRLDAGAHKERVTTWPDLAEYVEGETTTGDVFLVSEIGGEAHVYGPPGDRFVGSLTQWTTVYGADHDGVPVDDQVRATGVVPVVRTFGDTRVYIQAVDYPEGMFPDASGLYQATWTDGRDWGDRGYHWYQLVVGERADLRPVLRALLGD